MWYEVFTVFSGIVMLGMAVVPGVPARDRVWLGGGGAAFIAYALYVANQTSGTYFFPVGIFLIPFLGTAIAVYDILRARNPEVSKMTPAQVVEEFVGWLKGAPKT